MTCRWRQQLSGGGTGVIASSYWGPMAIPCIISDIKRDIGSKIATISYRLHSTPPLGGGPAGIAI